MRTPVDLPGPPAAPLIGNALQFRRDRLGFLTGAARRYGDAVRLRLGPYDAVLLSHPDAVRDLLTVRQHDFSKGPVLQRARAVLGDGLLTSEGESHRRDRRLIQGAFHPPRVRGYADQMAQTALRAVSAWTPGREVDVHAEMVRSTLRVAGSTLFGSEVDEDVALVSDAIGDLLSAYSVLLLPFGRHLVRLPPISRRVRHGTAALDRLTARLIAERGVAAGDDLFSVLLEREADPRRVRDQLVTLLLAGHETTANALSFACHLLARSPADQSAVAEEVLEVCGAGGAPSAGDADRLPLTRAALAEALRMYPPSWTMGRQARADTEVAGVHLPAGTVVLVSQWVVHRDPRWWDRPDEFAPGRFGAADPRRPRFAYFPFGGGARQCIGERFAFTEGVLTLAAILARWRLRPAPGRELALSPLLTLRPRDGAWVVPEPRRRGT